MPGKTSGFMDQIDTDMAATNHSAPARPTPLSDISHQLQTIPQALWDRYRGRQRVHLLSAGATGGTELLQVLSGAQLPAHRVLMLARNRSATRLPKGDQILLTVRDPIERFLNGFDDRHQKRGPNNTRLAWTSEESAAFLDFPSADALAQALSSENPRERANAERAMRNIGVISESYWDWFEQPAMLERRMGDVLHVVAYEQIANDFGQLRRLLQLESTIAMPTLSHLEGYELSDVALHNLRQWYEPEYRFLAQIKRWFPHLPDYSKGPKAWSRSTLLLTV